MAIDAFIKFEGGQNPIKGESQDSKLKASDNWSSLQGVTFGSSNKSNIGTAGGGGGANKVEFEDFSITKLVDAASPQLFTAICTGDHYDMVTISIRKAGGSNEPPDPFLEYKFALVFVTNVATDVSESDEAPKETVKFAYGAMQVQYKPQDAKGKLGSPVMKAWSRVMNKASLSVA